MEVFRFHAAVATGALVLSVDYFSVTVAVSAIGGCGGDSRHFGFRVGLGISTFNVPACQLTIQSPVTFFVTFSSQKTKKWGVGCGLWVVGCGLWVVGCGVWLCERGVFIPQIQFW